MNILLIDGGQAFSFTGGRLNHTLQQTARETLSALGHAIKETVIEDGYDKEAEVEKWLWMDAVIWQMPGWWMGEPWTVKKYVDEVFSAGVGEGKLVASRRTPSRQADRRLRHRRFAARQKTHDFIHLERADRSILPRR